ncbi:unnamed protein product [Cuscuta epithymum]|uniref:DUF1985 domain-containing protein n=1 Tax=Cuscuta epithymum TaxID=186058 RepID=A0AAV0DA01_9ASTE|nr:unnamed protein product [Cuscuta epithymum]
MFTIERRCKVGEISFVSSVACSLRNMPWGHLVDVLDLQFSAQIVHSLLLRLVCDQPKYELWFCVNDELLKFTYADFERITGFCSISPTLVISDDDEGNGTLLDKFFGGATEISFGTLTAKMKSIKPKKRGREVQGE